jgi:hypothetical protein
MGIFYKEADVDANGASEVNLRTAVGAELLGQNVQAASLPVVIASDQSSLNVKSRSGSVVQHINGTATTSPSTLTFTNPSYSILIDNGSNSGLLVSFNGGTTFKAILSKSSLAIDATLNSIVVKTSAGSSTYEILVVE